MSRFLAKFVSAAVLLLCLGVAEGGDVRTATVLYFNDAHQLAPVVDRLGERGGVARLAAVVKAVREDVPDAILAFGGDLAGGVLFGAVFRGLPMVEALNRLGVNVATFGQHDFDFGPDQTATLVRASNFQWITSNLVDETGGTFLDLPTTLTLERQGLRIGFIGLTDAMETTTRRGDLRQLDLIDGARSAVAELQRQGVDVVIAITQARLNVNEGLLLAIPEVDAVLSEERSETRSTTRFVGHRPILTPCGNIGSVVRLDIKVETGSRPLLFTAAIPVDSSLAGDPVLAELESHYVSELERRLSEPLAALVTRLESGMYGDGAARFRETNAGNLIADAFRSHHKADIGVINGGGIRSNVEAGPFTLKEALSLLPFGNRVCLASIDGALLLRALEHGVSRVEEGSGAFWQVSGMRYTYDPEAPTGERIVRAEVGGRPVDESQTYTVALPGYLVDGGDGFAMLEEGQLLIGPSDAPEDVVVLADYCRQLERIHARIENRISIRQE